MGTKGLDTEEPPVVLACFQHDRYLTPITRRRFAHMAASAGPHFAGALVARDLGDSGPDGRRRFDYVLTYERALVLRAARSLVGRLAPVPPRV